MTSFYTEINGFNIHYEKVGKGDKILLLIPGLTCSTRPSFSEQLDGGLDLYKFTLVAVDLPGWGKSRPPERKHTRNIYQKDAAVVTGLMEKLNFKKYSILGWSYGSLVGLFATINNPTRVEKLITIGGFAHVDDAIFKSATTPVTDMKGESPKTIIDAYGEELARELWESNAEFWKISRSQGELNWDLRKEGIQNIKCPTLIVHGDKDELVDYSHAHTLKKEIRNSCVLIFSGGSHQPQQDSANEFNEILERFLLE